MLTAHSGSDGTEDNSLAFVRHALQLGVDCLEVDVRMDDGGKLVMAHDERISAPSLSDAFALLREANGTHINCDLKTPGLEWPVWCLATQCGVQHRLIYSGDVSADAFVRYPVMRDGVEWFYNLELRFPPHRIARGLSEENLDPAEMAFELKRTLRKTGASCLNLNWQLRCTAFWDALRQAEIPLSVWTPDNPELIRSLLQENVHNITTRNAQSAVLLRDEIADRCRYPAFIQ